MACWPVEPRGGSCRWSLALEVLLGGLVISLLGNAGDVQHAVHPPVAASVEAVSDGLVGALARGDGDRSGATPAGEAGFGGESVVVTDLGQSHSAPLAYC